MLDEQKLINNIVFSVILNTFCIDLLYETLQQYI